MKREFKSSFYGLNFQASRTEYGVLVLKKDENSVFFRRDFLLRATVFTQLVAVCLHVSGRHCSTFFVQLLPFRLQPETYGFKNSEFVKIDGESVEDSEEKWAGNSGIKN